MDKPIAYTFFPDKNHCEGFGSIFQSEVFAFMYAKYHHKPYFRTKFKLYNGHGNTDQQNEKEQYHFFDFLNSSLSQTDFKLVNINFNESYKFISNLTSIQRDSLINTVREAYINSKEKVINQQKDKEYKIALHLRSFSNGDVMFSLDSLPWQCFNYDYGLKFNNPKFYSIFYSDIVHLILKSIPEEADKKVTIYSTGNISSFEDIKNRINSNLEIKLNNNVLDDFIELVNSDYLILAQSSLSYLASILHVGPKYIREGFRHFTTSDTVIIKDNIIANFSEFDRIHDAIKLFYLRTINYFKKKGI